MANLPSTAWKEAVSPDEEESFRRYSVQLALLQKAMNKKFGKGRLLHRKPIAALTGKLTIHSDLPQEAKQGLFKEPKTYDVLVRLSNGGLEIKNDKDPDIRGFALKVLGVVGKGNLNESPGEQDFLMINQERFSSPTAEPFLDTLLALAQGPKELLKHLYKTNGFFGMIRVIQNSLSIFNKPFRGFAGETFNTVTPHACGDYAIKVRVRPVGFSANATTGKNWGEEFRKIINQQALKYDLEIQFFTNEIDTPIEDASVIWSEDKSPFVKVGELEIPSQSIEGQEYDSFFPTVESRSFDPWNGLEAHRPLGNIMRARKVAYFMSQKGRKQ